MNKAVKSPIPASWLQLIDIHPDRYRCDNSNCKHNVETTYSIGITNCVENYIEIGFEGECSKFVEKEAKMNKVNDAVVAFFNYTCDCGAEWRVMDCVISDSQSELYCHTCGRYWGVSLVLSLKKQTQRVWKGSDNEGEI